MTPSNINSPLVSVLIPAFNVSPYIEQAIISAVNQSWKNLEIIVINDGSTDQTAEIVFSLYKRLGDSRLRVLEQENRGLSGARNTGLANARGDYIAFLDGDDIWRRNKVEWHLKVFQRDSRAGITFSDSEYMTDAGECTGIILASDLTNPTLADMVRRNHCGNGSTVIARRQCFHEAGGFREDLASCEDYEMWCRIAGKTSWPFMRVAQPLTLYRQRPSSLTFDAKRFARQADLAIQCLRDADLPVAEKDLLAGHAEHYRIAAWRAASANDAPTARQLMRCAVRMYPALLLKNRRAAAAAIMLMMPASLRHLVSRRIDRHRAHSFIAKDPAKEDVSDA